MGVVGFKCFVATCGDKTIDNDFRDVDDFQFLRGAEIISKFNDSRVLVHCENASICDELGRAEAQGRITAHDYVASRPVYTEVRQFAACYIWQKWLIAQYIFAISVALKALLK